MSDSNHARDDTAAGPGARGRARHKWFPALILTATAIWWIRQASQAQYQTLNHFVVSIACLALISLWFVRFGGGSHRFRQYLVGGIWLCLVGFLALNRPVFNGDMGIFDWRLRFGRDADERLNPIDAAGEANNWQSTPRDYPRFLGNGYWAEVTGVQLETDWRRHAPQEVWRREIGAGWSSFAIVGNNAVTQEQRGDLELVTCYRVDTGEPVWTHSDLARFDPADVAGSLGDIGPRATPTIQGERIFTQGGTGIVNCLDARTGNVLWTCDTAEEFDSAVALWGKSGSPLVVHDMVIVSVGGPVKSSDAAPDRDLKGDKYNSSLVAFDIASGDVRWASGTRNASYASPVLKRVFKWIVEWRVVVT